MYVAITRARKRLFMTFSQTRMHGRPATTRSRFFDELPEQSIKWLSPKIAQHHWFANPKSAWDEVPEAATTRSPRSFSRQTDSGWRIGQNVAHAKFGEGVIVNIEGAAARHGRRSLRQVRHEAAGPIGGQAGPRSDRTEA
jgi:DNA helicase-2/ATP-dependent DNA helicase PcrA